MRVAMRLWPFKIQEARSWQSPSTSWLFKSKLNFVRLWRIRYSSSRTHNYTSYIRVKDAVLVSNRHSAFLIRHVLSEALCPTSSSAHNRITKKVPCFGKQILSPLRPNVAPFSIFANRTFDLDEKPTVENRTSKFLCAPIGSDNRISLADKRGIICEEGRPQRTCPKLGIA